MSHIAVDLKVVETHVPSVARAAGVSEDRVLAGLVRLWHRCWSVSREALSRVELAGAFGPERLDDLISALCVDFLEVQGDGSYRVRGADQYLRIKDARRRGAEKTNRAMAERRSSDAPATLNRSLPNALTPSTEHRAPNTEKAAAGDPLPLTTAEGFWVACQDRRDAIPGMVREQPPAKLDHWFSDAMMHVHGDEQRLLAGYELFLVDPFWRNQAKQRCHWGGWIKQWRDFVTRAGAAPVEVPLTDKSTRAPQPTHDWADVTPGEVTFG